MLVQPTYVAAGGASGHHPNPSQVPAIAEELENLRDGLAAGEVSTSQAAYRLTNLLATLSDPRTDIPTTMFGRPAFPRWTFPRWTFGGYCTSCLTYACQDPRCGELLTRYTWVVCPLCKGSGYRDIDQNPNGDVNEPCDCYFGAVEVEPLPMQGGGQ